MHRPALLLVVALVVGVGLVMLSSAPARSPEGVELKVVRYPELAAAVRAQVGKVVVVDIWGTFCKPCKEEFPHLVELHRRLASRGLVCMSVTIDPDEPRTQAAALKFLQTEGATFPNFLLDEKTRVWQEKWGIKGVPVVFVFDRKGRRAAKFDNDDPDKQFNYTRDVEPLVDRLVNEP
jgi:thiol-disulfide isomerase/thioredoxin